MYSTITVLALATVGALASPAPAPASGSSVYKFNLDRRHLVSRSTSKMFNPAQVQKDLNKTTRHATNNAVRYGQYLRAHKVEKRSSNAKTVARAPFDVAALRKRQTVDLSLTDDVVYGQDK
jgi:hypothetical protein